MLGLPRATFAAAVVAFTVAIGGLYVQMSRVSERVAVVETELKAIHASSIASSCGRSESKA
jgi:hypothetical protein